MPDHYGGRVPKPGWRDPAVGESGMISRQEAERIVASCDPVALARAAYREAFPNPGAHIHGQVVLDLITGEVRPSAYVEGHANDPRFDHLLPLAECEAELKGRLSEEEFVLHIRDGQQPTTEVEAKLDIAYGKPRRTLTRMRGRS